MENDYLLLKQQFESYKEITDRTINELKRNLEDYDKRLLTMEKSKEKTDFQYEQIMDTLKKLNEVTIPNLTAQIEELKNKPAKRYDQVVTGIIGAIVGAIGGAIANTFIKR